MYVLILYACKLWYVVFVVCTYKADKAPKSTHHRSIVYHSDVGLVMLVLAEILNFKF